MAAPPATDAPVAGAEVASERQPVLSVRNLVKHFPVRSRGVIRRTIGDVHAVCDISFDLHAHETLGLVGESGCGKTTLARAILGLQAPTAGTVEFEGKPVERTRSGLRALRRQAQLVFQDPTASLNPRQTVYEIVAEGPRLHRLPDDAQLLQVHGRGPLALRLAGGGVGQGRVSGRLSGIRRPGRCRTGSGARPAGGRAGPRPAAAPRPVRG